MDMTKPISFTLTVIQLVSESKCLLNVLGAFWFFSKMRLVDGATCSLYVCKIENYTFQFDPQRGWFLPHHPILVTGVVDVNTEHHINLEIGILLGWRDERLKCRSYNHCHIYTLYQSAEGSQEWSHNRKWHFGVGLWKRHFKGAHFKACLQHLPEMPHVLCKIFLWWPKLYFLEGFRWGLARGPVLMFHMITNSVEVIGLGFFTSETAFRNQVLKSEAS